MTAILEMGHSQTGMPKSPLTKVEDQASTSQNTFVFLLERPFARLLWIQTKVLQIRYMKIMRCFGGCCSRNSKGDVIELEGRQ